MAYRITPECNACGACVEGCPVEAIAYADPVYRINPDECTDCGACQAACPVDAILAPDVRVGAQISASSALSIFASGQAMAAAQVEV